MTPPGPVSRQAQQPRVPVLQLESPRQVSSGTQLWGHSFLQEDVGKAALRQAGGDSPTPAPQLSQPCGSRNQSPGPRNSLALGLVGGRISTKGSHTAFPRKDKHTAINPRPALAPGTLEDAKPMLTRGYLLKVNAYRPLPEVYHMFHWSTHNFLLFTCKECILFLWRRS